MADFTYTPSGELKIEGISQTQVRSLIIKVLEFSDNDECGVGFDDTRKIYFDNIFNYTEEFKEYKR